MELWECPRICQMGPNYLENPCAGMVSAVGAEPTALGRTDNSLGTAGITEVATSQPQDKITVKL